MSDAAARAARAQQLLDDPLLAEVFAEMRADLMRDWENTPENAVERREAAWRAFKGIERLQAKLRSVVDNGKLEAAKADRQATRAEPGA